LFYEASAGGTRSVIEIVAQLPKDINLPVSLFFLAENHRRSSNNRSPKLSYQLSQ
jgi:hypothetical protein